MFNYILLNYNGLKWIEIIISIMLGVLVSMSGWCVYNELDIVWDSDLGMAVWLIELDIWWQLGIISPGLYICL